MANGKNAATLFFALTAMAFWIKYLGGGDIAMHLDLGVAVQIALAIVKGVMSPVRHGGGQAIE